jgi:hypothetical protein
MQQFRQADLLDRTLLYIDDLPAVYQYSKLVKNI